MNKEESIDFGEYEPYMRRWKVVELLGIGRIYQCTVDGHAEFRGEVLPAGTEESILAWIKARYKVIGEVHVGNADPWRRNIIIYTRIFDPSYCYYETVAKRYLVEVEDCSHGTRTEKRWFREKEGCAHRKRKENSSRLPLMCEIVL